MSARPDDLVMGGLALLLVPLIGWRIYRGLRTGRLPLYRTSIDRGAGGGRFELLLVLHLLSLLLVSVVAADHLLGLGLRERL